MMVLAVGLGNVMARLRTVEAGLGYTYTLPMDQPPITHAKEGLSTYATHVKEDGKHHKNGSPHGWGGAEFLEGCANTPGVSQEQIKILQESVAKCNTPDLVGQEITVFRIAKAFKENTQ